MLPPFFSFNLSSLSGIATCTALHAIRIFRMQYCSRGSNSDNYILFLFIFIFFLLFTNRFLEVDTVGAESLCRCRWKVRYLKPLDLKSQMTLKCFHYEFERWICRPLSWYNMNCLEFVIILLPVPKVNKLSMPIFVRKKEILPLMGENFFFNWREMLFNGLRWVWSEK